MGEMPIAKVPNLGDNITSNKEVRLVEAIMLNLKENAPKQQVQFKIPPNDKQKELNKNNNKGLQEGIKINNGKLKSKEVQVVLTRGKKQKEPIHNLEINHASENNEILVQNNEPICIH